MEDDLNMTLSDSRKSFDIYLCIKHIDVAWREVFETDMTGVWKALCSQFVNCVQGFDQEGEKKILEKLVRIFKKLDINLEEDYFQELFESHLQKLTNKN